MEIDTRKEIRRAVDTGKVIFGEKTAEKNMLKGIGEVLIVSHNIKSATKERLEHYAKLSEIELLEFDGTAKELGAICGKPFPVQAMVVLDTGKSNIKEAGKEENVKPKTSKTKTKAKKSAKKK
ncbi:MAG: 50S ribosomal protein L30e [archaeon]|nr:50S ribosomal protein L30e [archaeon]